MVCVHLAPLRSNSSFLSCDLLRFLLIGLGRQQGFDVAMTVNMITVVVHMAIYLRSAVCCVEDVAVRRATQG